MAMSGGKDDGSPMMDINTTPLIDVMLVLLIMFIITIPPQSHAVKLDLPQNQSNQPPPPIDPKQPPAAADRPDQEQGRRDAGRSSVVERSTGQSNPASPISGRY